MRLAGGRFLVTGGSGFIGSHLVDRLVAEGAGEVLVFDNALREENLAASLTSGRVRVMEGDLSRSEQVRLAVSAMEGIFHMGTFQLQPCTQDPRRCLEVNVMGTFNLLEAARDAGVQKVVFSSASSVYGDTPERVTEDHPLNTRTMYGASKIAAEYLFRAFHEMCGLDYIVLRYMNVYGPRQVGAVVANVARRIKEGLPPIIVGDGSQSFDFIYVDDVVEANLLAMSSPVTDEAINVSGDNEVTIRDLVNTLLELANSPLKPEVRAEERSVMLRRVGSGEKARRLLGFTAKTHLKEGLERVLEFQMAQSQ